MYILSCKLKNSFKSVRYIDILKNYCNYDKAKDYLRYNLPHNYSDFDVTDLTNTWISCIETAVSNATS